VSLAGALTFSGLGLLVACRARTIEAISGLLNFLMLPMWILSGVFFSSAHFPAATQPLIHALPLTALNDALRAVMLDGASLASVSRELAILAAWALASFALALRLFRWR
jgi:ABC-type multidrug transport system permease subunit